jgi:hypothetical protein
VNARHSEDILRTLPRPVAVVGNATPRRAWGAVIERYATVIRLNNFRTTGFEALVGYRTDVRCTSGWEDIEHRTDCLEISPFTASAVESVNLPRFNAANARPVLTASIDVKRHMPEVSKPSTGCALAQLLEMIDVPADLFGFDGFRTSHYWREPTVPTTHSDCELPFLLSRERMAVYVEVDGDVAEPDAAAIEASEGTCRLLCQQGLIDSLGGRVLEVGGGPTPIGALLEPRGQAVTSVTLARRETSSDDVVGDAPGVLALAFLEPAFDGCLSIGVLHHLTPNDVRVFVRQAARLAERLLVTVAVAPENTSDTNDRASGTGGPAPGVTRRSTTWWTQVFSSHFDVNVEPAGPDACVVIRGARRIRPESHPHSCT